MEALEITPAEIATVVHILKKLSPGFLPFDIFLQTARLTVLTTLELVPLRLRDGVIEVLLTEREADDPFWAGQLHIPGTVIRATDGKGSFQDALERLQMAELKGITFASDVYYIKFVFQQTKRGNEIAFIHCVEIQSEPLIGVFYPVSTLPANLVMSQKIYIEEAAALFKQHKDAMV